jgi:phosphatidylinositol glycan class W
MIIYLITCVCVLAVDFTYFPFLLAKTDRYGISLMDLGVGLFIVCHSLRLIRNSDDENEKM